MESDEQQLANIAERRRETNSEIRRLHNLIRREKRMRLEKHMENARLWFEISEKRLELSMFESHLTTVAQETVDRLRNKLENERLRLVEVDRQRDYAASVASELEQRMNAKKFELCEAELNERRLAREFQQLRHRMERQRRHRRLDARLVTDTPGPGRLRQQPRASDEPRPCTGATRGERSSITSDVTAAELLSPVECVDLDSVVSDDTIA